MSGGGFWSSEKLTVRLKAEKLIVPFDPAKVVTASYELTLGSEMYVSPDAASSDASMQTVRILNPNECFTIPPGQFAYIITEEKVTVPADAIALISLKTTNKWKGLINVSGFHVDPGFSGKIVFTVFNAGPAPIHLRSGASFFLIWYVSLDQKTEDTRKIKGFEHIDEARIIPGKVPSTIGLHKRIQRIEAMHNYFIAIAAFFGILSGLAFTVIWDSVKDRLQAPYSAHQHIK